MQIDINRMNLVYNCPSSLIIWTTVCSNGIWLQPFLVRLSPSWPVRHCVVKAVSIPQWLKRVAWPPPEAVWLSTLCGSEAHSCTATKAWSIIQLFTLQAYYWIHIIQFTPTSTNLSFTSPNPETIESLTTTNAPIFQFTNSNIHLRV